MLCAEIKKFCMWLTGMKKLIFHYTNFFGLGHFLIHHFWKKTSMVKIQKLLERISNIPSRGWRAWKNWFFILTTFLARGIFLIHQIQKKVKKRPEPKKILYPKITGIVSVNLAKEFFKYILHFKTFLPEPHMAHIAPILKKKFSNSKFISFLIYIFRKSLIDIGPWEVDPIYYVHVYSILNDYLVG